MWGSLISASGSGRTASSPTTPSCTRAWRPTPRTCRSSTPSSPRTKRAGATRSSWAPAWTTACGSPSRSGPTNGCSTTPTRPSPPRGGASPGASCSTARDACASRWLRRDWSACAPRATGDPADGAVLAVPDRGVVPRLGADVELARPGDLGVLVEHLLPVGQPSAGAGDGEQDREHLEREPHRLVDEARVEVDVRVEVP